MERTIAPQTAGPGNKKIDGMAWRDHLGAALSTLARIWQKTRATIWNVRSKLGSDIAQPLDIETISTHLAVLKRAKEEGSRDLPPPKEEVPTGTQREIIAYFTNLRRRAQRQVAETAEKANRALEQLHTSDAQAKIRDIPAGCENKILRYFADAEALLTNTTEREQKQKRHYDTFRKENSLDRVANYPRSAYRYYLIIPLLVVAIAIALAGVAETSAGGNSGVPTAWIIAVSVAAVFLPFMFGDLILRSINHVDDFNRFFATIGVVAAIAGLFFVAYYADLYIAAMLAGLDTSHRQIMEEMLAAPLALVTGVMDWKVFALVVLAGVFAMIQGYRSDDPYPGYGAVQRSYYKARDGREEAVTRLRKRINTSIDEAEAEIAKVSADFNGKVRTYQRLIEKSKQGPSALIDYDVELEDTCNILLDRYRMANTAARQSDVPMSFAEHVCFNPESERDSVLRTDSDEQVEELITAVADLEKEATLARQNLRALNLRMIQSTSEPEPDDAA